MSETWYDECPECGEPAYWLHGAPGERPGCFFCVAERDGSARFIATMVNTDVGTTCSLTSSGWCAGERSHATLPGLLKLIGAAVTEVVTAQLIGLVPRPRRGQRPAVGTIAALLGKAVHR